MPKKSQQIISIPRHRFPWGFYPGSPMQQERPRILWISHGFPPKNQWDGMGNILGILFLMDFMVFSMYPWVYISLYQDGRSNFYHRMGLQSLRKHKGTLKNYPIQW